MVPIHPGRILRRELQARGLSANASVTAPIGYTLVQLEVPL